MFYAAGILLCGWFGPWYAPSLFIVVASAIIGASLRKSIWAVVIASGLVFTGLSSWQWMHDSTGLIEKTGLVLGGMHPAILLIVTVVVGIITGVLSVWLGSTLHAVFKKEIAPQT